MAKEFTIKRVEITEADLQSTRFAQPGPLIRQELKNSLDPNVRAMVDSDPDKAEQAAREVARKYFRIK